MPNKRLRVQEVCEECNFYEDGICTCPWSDEYSEYRKELDTCDAWIMPGDDDDE